MTKRFFSALLTLLVALSALTPSYADGFTPVMPLEGDHGILTREGDFLSGGKASYISAYKDAKNANGLTVRQTTLCSKYGEPDCIETDSNKVEAKLLLGVCIDSEVNCIESVSIYKANEGAKDAEFVKQSQGPITPADLGADLPRGSTVSVWRANGIKHSAGSEDYAAFAQVNLHMASGRSVFDSFTAGVVPISESSQFGMPAPEVGTKFNANDGSTGIEIRNSGPHCVYNSNMVCAKNQEFTSDIRVAMVLRISNRLTGWLKGRLKDPKIAVSEIDQNYNRLSVDAMPVEVPQLQAFFTSSTLPAKVAELMPRMKEIVGKPGGTLDHLQVDQLRTFDIITALKEFTEDKVTGTNTMWTFSSLGNGANNCISDTKKLVGLVTTNSMAYLGSPPIFANGNLRYQVAGMHYMPDGKTAIEGTYDLIMRSDSARCLYGFNSAPISASISVLGEGGETRTAVTTMKEESGWLKLAAYGFTFSSPTISVKLTQATTKKSTITCTKGKLTKKVTGASPKCPSGYKKK